MKRKIKSIFLFFVAMLFISIGFFNFRVEKENYEISQNNNEKNGDIELVNSDAVEEEVDKVDEFDYFSESRINRENRYSQMLETYQKIIDSSEMSSDQKGIAIEEIKKIENQKNGILVSENLIKNKGFNDVVVFVNEESISVVIKSNVSLMKEQLVQIQNIISRELKSEIENINISIK